MDIFERCAKLSNILDTAYPGIHKKSPTNHAAQASRAIEWADVESSDMVCRPALRDDIQV